MKSCLVFLYVALYLGFCPSEKNQADNSAPAQSISNISTVEKKADPEPQPTKMISPKNLPVPKVITFSMQTFFRHSPTQNPLRQMTPPFAYGEITFFVESTKVKKGDSATAIWLSNDEENLSLKIRSATKIPYLNCTRKETGSDVEFDKITDRKLLEMKAVEGRSEDQPFEFFVIYPAVKKARRLNKTELTKEMLPESVAVTDVFAAVDLNEDGTPDLLISNYCCYDSSQCDCTSNYQKINSKWKYLGGSEPC